MNRLLLIALATVALGAITLLYVTEPRVRCEEGAAHMQIDGETRCVLMAVPSPVEGGR